MNQVLAFDPTLEVIPLSSKILWISTITLKITGVRSFLGVDRPEYIFTVIFWGYSMRFKVGVLSIALCGLLSMNAQAADLLDIYKEAVLRDPIVLQAKASRDQVFSAVDEATAALLPQINLAASVMSTHTNPPVASSNTTRTSSIDLSLSQAIWRHSSWINQSIATKNATKADLDYADALQNLILRVSQAYFNVLSARDTLTFTKANQAALKRQLDEATRRFHVGLIAETDQLEAQAAYDLASAQVITAENSLVNSYEEIRRLIGRPETDLNVLDENRFSPVPVTKSIEQIVKDAESNNLSLQSSIVSRDIAKDQISLAKTGHEPTIDLVGSIGTAHNNYSHESTTQIDGSTDTATIGVQLNLPIYSGGAVMSQVAQAEQGYIMASEAAEYEYRTVVTNAYNNYNNVQAAISSVRAYKQTETSAQSALAATQAGYDVGTRTISDVLDATQNLYSAKQSLSAARFNYIMSRLQLLYTQGDLTLQDIEQINSGLKQSTNR